MAIVVRKNRNQLDGKYIKDTTAPNELERGTQQEQADSSLYAYPNTGYHRTTIEEYLTGSCMTDDGYGGVRDPNKGASCYSRQYAKDGTLISCGVNWYQRLVQRLEMQLEATGEKVILYRRKWTGEKCPCYDHSRGQSRSRCPVCFSTGFVGGYVQYINIRETDGKIWVRVNPTQEDLELKEEGMFQSFEPSCWGLPTPILRDRDVVVRYNIYNGEETWRYEILNVQRNMGFFNKTTAQMFAMKRLDKTDPIYNIRIVDLKDNLVGQLLEPTTDILQQQIANDHGDGYQDQGYSEGYMAGYNKGHSDGFNNLDFYPIRDEDGDGYLDTPYGIIDSEIYDKKSYQEGYLEGYNDGFEDGVTQRDS